MFTALYLTPSGFTTSAIPVGLRLIELRLDLFAPRIEVLSSDGRHSAVALGELPTIAATYAALLAALKSLGVDVTLSPIPQEIPDLTPFDRDERPLVFEPNHAQAWLTAVSSTQAVFDRWRDQFFGRAGVQLWWGAFDLSLLLFTGKHVAPPLDRGYLFKYDLDAEMLSAGLYPGDDANEAFFYGYIYPQPDDCAAIPLRAEGAKWSAAMGEWILPYDTVRRAAQPEELLRMFLGSIYDTCGRAANWNTAELTYVPPPLRHARLA